MTAISYQQALDLLRQALNNPNAEFRDGQWEAIEGLVERNERMLVVQRTGWGKSIVYFLATRLLRDRGAGPTLLVSPLLALMRNQLLAAQRLGVRAETVNSSNRDDWQAIYERIRSNQVDILLISPERLANEQFRDDVLLPMTSRIGFFVVDEAHCISDWGHDFRPDYLRIARILQALPQNIPVLATTATANNRVVADVQGQLGPTVSVSRGPLVRESLRLQNIALPSQAARMAWLAEQVPRLPGSGIIYTLTVRDAQRLAEWLRSQGVDAHAYWGDRESSEREDLEQQLLNNGIKALIATTALGMGFDKPDLGFVIHYQRPGSVVHYYQQVGRAGRALDTAYGILLSGAEDQEITEYFIRTAFPPEAHVDEVLEALQSADDGLSIPMLERQVNLTRGQIEKVLKSLAVKSPAPVTKDGSRWHATPVRYAPDRDKVERLTQMRYREQARMADYMQSRECLMLFLARELDDNNPTACGKCAICYGGPLLSHTFSRDLVTRAVQFLRRSDQPIEPRRQWASDALSSYGWVRGNIPLDLRAEEGRALSVWGDDGWGEQVRRGKRVEGRFDDELVGAVVAMLQERWRPDPFPTWVTCVPSLTHAALVPDFARRVAQRLGLPFVQCIRKVQHTSPQKEMENSYQQAHNLDNAFSVDARLVQDGPVLLLDDMVDSRWTFTVAAALLRQAGSGPVYPLALADTASKDRDRFLVHAHP
ncbi:MAG TPA: RecQ family ATP-dependent DNA helicase [Chloroflexia bacterium]|nr:RecQ family ATP-dependent DNA helicase [Chloroflexia bacterium]